MGVKELIVTVPPNATPGESQLQIPHGNTNLVVSVPKSAAPGDELILTEGSKGTWECRVSKAGGNSIVSVIPETASDTELKIRIPPGVVSGVTQLLIQYDPGSTKSNQNAIRMIVPEHMRHGDLIELHRQDASSGWQVQSYIVSNRELARESEKKSISLSNPIIVEGCCERMIEAAREAGAFVSSKVKRGSAAPLWIPGLIAVDSIEKGETLIQIPGRLQLSPATFGNIFPSLFKAIGDIPSSIIAGNASDRALAVSIACLLKFTSDCTTAGKIPDEDAHCILASVPSLWHQYAETLLGENFGTHPPWMFICEPDRLFKLLEPSEEAEIAQGTVAEIMKAAELIYSYAENDIPNPGFGVGNFLHARLCLVSRKFATPYGNCLCPVVDLMNHSNDPGAVVAWDPKTDSSIVRTLRAHSAGEEIFITYEALSNPLLLRQYGFTLPPEMEPAWTFASKVRQLHKRGVPGPWEMMIGRVTLLEFHSGYITDSLGTAFQACLVQGLSPEVFLRSFLEQKIAQYEKDELLQPALRALQRKRDSDVTSVAWWTEPIQVPYETNDEAGVRVKMSEYLCLTAHLQALDHAAGKLPQERCLASTVALRTAMRDAWEVFKKGGYIECTVGCGGMAGKRVLIEIPEPAENQTAV